MNDVVPYSGNSVAVYTGGDGGTDGVITHATPVTLTNEDHALIESFGDIAAGQGLDRSRSMRAAQEYYRGVMQEQAASDENDRTQVRTTMQREWGAGYAANVKRIRSLIDSLPPAVGDMIWDGRTIDGTLALNDPSVLRWLLRLTQPAGSYQGPQSIDRELKEIESLMRKHGSRYWKGPDAEKIQARYRELISMRG